MMEDKTINRLSKRAEANTFPKLIKNDKKEAKLTVEIAPFDVSIYAYLY